MRSARRGANSLHHPHSPQQVRATARRVRGTLAFTVRAIGILMLGAACASGEPSSRGPARSTIDAAHATAMTPDAPEPDVCAAAVAEVTAAGAAFDVEVARQGFTIEPRRQLPTGTEAAARGARGAAEAEMARAARARKAFAGKKSGDIVSYTVDGRTYRGLYLGPERQGTFVLGRKADRVYVLLPASARVVPCTDPDAPLVSRCGQPATVTVLALPEGTSFGGFVPIPREHVRLERTGPGEAACPP